MERKLESDRLTFRSSGRRERESLTAKAVDGATQLGVTLNLGCLKNRIYGIFISPIFGTIDHAGIYSLQNLIFDLIL